MPSDDHHRIEVDLAWANALGESVRAAKLVHTAPVDDLDLEWTVCAALAAALAQLAHDGRRFQLSWGDVSRVAQLEKDEIARHRTAATPTKDHTMTAPTTSTPRPRTPQ